MHNPSFLIPRSSRHARPSGMLCRNAECATRGCFPHSSNAFLPRRVLLPLPLFPVLPGGPGVLALPKSLAVALALTVPLAPLAAQSTTAASKPRPATRNPRPAAAAAAQAVAAPLAAPYDSLAFAALKWREIGPFRGGRSVAVAGTASRPMEYWFGTTGA